MFLPRHQVGMHNVFVCLFISKIIQKVTGGIGTLRTIEEIIKISKVRVKINAPSAGQK